MRRLRIGSTWMGGTAKWQCDGGLYGEDEAKNVAWAAIEYVGRARVHALACSAGDMPVGWYVKSVVEVQYPEQGNKILQGPKDPGIGYIHFGTGSQST